MIPHSLIIHSSMFNIDILQTGHRMNEENKKNYKHNLTNKIENRIVF